MILIKKEDNKEYELKTDYVYNNLEELINDKDFVKLIKKHNKKNCLFTKIKKLFKKIIHGK